ncbi:hypothetical protein [Xylophilus sp.]|uniref:hypothetical protein n=1 Tax=Xylophilus sp. TaxID=2653893 RepID=UPI0013B8C0A4|nr:hypothetical protein [Xylophilus sp.]KAF1045614.1 MAG: hypothetical protein GAK38_02906 [Xylophilus sp.]
MPKFRVIDGTPAPDTPAEKQRERIRKMAYKHMPSCTSCGGSEYITARIGNVRSKLCVICLTQGRRRVME